jgi:hypothetical protein
MYDFGKGLQGTEASSLLTRKVALLVHKPNEFGNGLRVTSSLITTNFGGHLRWPEKFGEITEKVWIVRRNM